MEHNRVTNYYSTEPILSKVVFGSNSYGEQKDIGRTSNINIKTSESDCNIAHMNRININEMTIDTTHFDKYLIVKLIELPCKLNAIHFWVRMKKKTL
jgi:hypothetical protein